MNQDGYRVTDKYVLFWGSEFSNFYPCKIIFDHKEFKSSEQLFMWCKAHCFQDYESEELILNAKTPKEAKEKAKPESFKGVPILLLSAGLIAMAFMCFSGLKI